MSYFINDTAKILKFWNFGILEFQLIPERKQVNLKQT